MESNFWFWFFFGIVVLIVSTQTITTYFVFESFSSITNTAVKRVQATAFCGIVSLLVIGSVFIGKTEVAIGGAILEVLINWFYYARDFFEQGFHTRKHKWKSIATFWRKYWLKMIFGFVIPYGIYLCSELMLELSGKSL